MAACIGRYAHYHNKYGRTAEGFLTYVKEQVEVLDYCSERHTGQIVHGGLPMDRAAAERHCALYLEVGKSKWGRHVVMTCSSYLI